MEPIYLIIVTDLLEYGLGIRDPEKNLSRIPRPKKHQIPDPNSQQMGACMRQRPGFDPYLEAWLLGGQV